MRFSKTYRSGVVLSAQCNQEERRRTKVRRLSFVHRGFGKLAFQGPWTQTPSGLWPGRSFLIAPGQTELPEGPRPDGISGLNHRDFTSSKRDPSFSIENYEPMFMAAEKITVLS